MYQNEQVEKTILAFLLRDVNFINISQQFLKEDFFYYRNLRRLYKLITKVFNKWHTTLSFEMFEDVLNRHPELSETDRMNFLVLFRELEAVEYDDTKFNYYLDTLADLKMKREMTALFERYKDQVDVLDGKDLVEAVNTDLHKIRIQSNLLIVEKGFVFEDVAERMEEYEIRKEQGEVPGVPYGWKELDRQTGGHFPGELTLIFARMGGGKTRILHTFAYNAAQAGRKGMFITIEMSRKEIARMSDSRLCKLYYEQLKKATLSPEDEEKWRSILSMMEASDNKGIYLVDMPRGCTTSSVEEEINQYERKYGKLDFIVIDYLMLMDPVEKTLNREDKYGNIAKELKQIARLKKVSILTAMQANRKVNEIEDPLQVGLEHVALSDQIPAHVNTALYVYRDANDVANNMIHANMVKSRDGATYNFALHTNFKLSFIGDLETAPKEQEAPVANQ